MSTDLLTCESPATGEACRPLDTVRVRIGAPAATAWRALDGAGREYARGPVQTVVEFTAGGALGHHTILLLDPQDRLIASAGFLLACRTELDDGGGPWRRLFDMLHWNIHKGREPKIVRYQGRAWFLFSDWIRDHVHILKGKKYFFAGVKDAIDLFAVTQRDDGMLFDFYMPMDAPTSTGAAHRYRERHWVELCPENAMSFQRVPVESDVEYLFTEGLYFTWKATGDTAWMRSRLDAAVKAMRYCVASPLRWSKKFQLIRRGYTIDTWDFQTDADSAVTGDTMDVDPDRTSFGIMHGDNTGYAASCEYLADMLEAADRAAEATAWRERRQAVMQRLTEVAWNGRFFRHFVPEDAALRREPQVDEREQVSLSNTYALNRGIAPEQAAAILGTYQRIRREMPASSPGEFYGIYPPFDDAFRRHLLRWHYVNGGVFPFIAGELAHGAFEHGFETYGVDLLRRIAALLESHDGQFPYYWLGNIEPAPARRFTKVSLRDAANADISGRGAPGVPGWTRAGEENDLANLPTGAQVYHDIPFDVIDPAANGRRACIGLSAQPGYRREIAVPVNGPAAAIYLHHTLAGGGLAGWLDLVYADGSTHRQYMEAGRHVKNWWDPTDVPYNRVEGWRCRVAWRGPNRRCDVGTYVWGLNNPHPEKPIAQLTFTHAGLGNTWFILGVTLCDAPVYFEPQDACYGWLENWNSAAVIYALLEGLAGIRDEGVAFSRARIAPRWAAAGEGTETVAAISKYEASQAYTGYRWRFDRARGRVAIDFTGSGADFRLEILLPEDRTVASATLDGTPAECRTRSMEHSRYACLDVRGTGAHRLELQLRVVRR